ncbi:MAG: 2'-5' RNA ligase family protein [Muribaculaceae bacterium]|nr:2'-5' RNA ligase family protein [Muribaculaceae bacterium]
MKSYLELKVPIRYVDSWFAELRELLDGVNVRWQRDYYHITMVFLDYAPDNVNLVPGLSERLEDALAPTITFDRLDAFATGGGHKQVIHLTTSHVPEDFLALVQDIRRYMKGKGCDIQSDFRLHVTLGRVQDPRTNLRQIKEAISQVDLPDITLDLSNVEYRVFRGKTLGQWRLFQ